MKEATIRTIFARLKKATPHPTTELLFDSPFELLIAVMLSAQATDKSVNKVTPTLFQIANSPDKMVKLTLTALEEKIKTIGLYKTKAKHILATCHILQGKYHSRVPETREELESLPGVGRKTANVILNTCFNQPTIAVDTHVFRVANRIGLAKGKTVLVVEKQLEKNIPHLFKQNAHHWLIMLGRYTCIAQKPKCPICPIRDLCEYPHKTKE